MPIFGGSVVPSLCCSVLEIIGRVVVEVGVWRGLIEVFLCREVILSQGGDIETNR